MLIAIWDNLREHACPGTKEDVKHEEDVAENPDLGKLSEDDKPGWVIGTISKILQHCMKCFRQKHMMLDELTHPEWGDVAEYFPETRMKYRMAKLEILAVVKPQTDMTAATPPPTTFGEIMLTFHIIPVQSQLPLRTSWSGSCEERLGSGKLQPDIYIASLLPDGVPGLI